MVFNDFIRLMTTLTPKGYRKRPIDSTIGEYLKAFGAVDIRGPKYCGKTCASRNHAKSETCLRSAETRKLLELYRTDPTLILSGGEPHLIDERQDIPAKCGAARTDVDENP